MYADLIRNSHLGTEEDTFNRLKRIPFVEMFDKVRNFHETVDYLESKDQKEASRKLLADHGWTVTEYLDERYKQYKF